jgi:hypothetical protein
MKGVSPFVSAPCCDPGEMAEVCFKSSVMAWGGDAVGVVAVREDAAVLGRASATGSPGNWQRRGFAEKGRANRMPLVSYESVNQRQTMSYQSAAELAFPNRSSEAPP